VGGSVRLMRPMRLKSRDRRPAEQEAVGGSVRLMRPMCLKSRETGVAEQEAAWGKCAPYAPYAP
jgi:hypothetical protein